MKKIAVLLLVLCFLLCGCGPSEEELACQELYTKIEEACELGYWGRMNNLAQELKSTYPDLPEVDKVDNLLKENADRIYADMETVLKEGDLEEAQVLVSMLPENFSDEKRFISYTKALEDIAGKYEADHYLLNGAYTDNKYKEKYYLEVTGKLNDKGLMSYEITVELPGMFYCLSSNCFTMKLNNVDPWGDHFYDKVEIDTFNERIVKKEDLQVKYVKSEGIYSVHHCMYMKDGGGRLMSFEFKKV